MHFASSLSDYFLLIGDQVHCTPNFVTTMYGALQAWEEQPWTTLEFSSLSFSGKVFHASDLSRLASFLLLFQGAPTDRLLSEFRLLSNQNVPIRLSPSLFQHVGNFSQLEDACFSVEREKVFGDPDNPSGSVITDMFALLNTLPQDAYTLGEDYFFTYDPVRGNHLTVVLEEPQKVTRIEVLTGSAEDGTHHLQLGQIELGSDPMGQPRDCVRYVLLGPLVQGNLDQRVFYEEEDSVKKMSCIRLLALGSEQSWLVIRKIKVWMESG
ncbi:alpha-1,3-mannosyl-glycoprotein 4-beta-N-acetylglucosaminyltransferase-like protein MGAT4E [Tenrec ecaudatus]|uniref:alpha-1,3-mannosyl-glycoprotein 4-beta-N-acetylglucosaminyltransferase-like protein MGAT4E n=1 Tax=Tenrec ecaudatus TaxID=94439 RepID=UPI003F5A99CC